MKEAYSAVVFFGSWVIFNINHEEHEKIHLMTHDWWLSMQAVSSNGYEGFEKIFFFLKSSSGVMSIERRFITKLVHMKIISSWSAQERFQNEVTNHRYESGLYSDSRVWEDWNETSMV